MVIIDTRGRVSHIETRGRVTQYEIIDASGQARKYEVIDTRGLRATKYEWIITEDVLLKDLVRRNGTAQWDKVAQYFVYKSAEQCEARWYECFDPSIIKRRQEEEKAAVGQLAQRLDAVVTLNQP